MYLVRVFLSILGRYLLKHSQRKENQRTNGPVNAHLISWPSTYKTWKIYG